MSKYLKRTKGNLIVECGVKSKKYVEKDDPIWQNLTIYNFAS